MSEASNPERGPVAAQTLDGGWFRKERERIAVGRKGIALRLGSTESKVTTLETRKHDVPTEWFGVLRELGFRFPADVAQAETPVASVVTDVVQAAAIPSPPSDVPVVIAAEFAVSASDPPSASADAVIEAVVIEAVPTRADIPTTAETATPVSPVIPAIPQAEMEARKEEKTPNVEPIAEASVPQDAQTLVPSNHSEPLASASLTPFCGRWMRERRRERGIRTQDLVTQLRTLPADLYTIERHNIRLPLRWIPGLLKLGLLTVDEAKVATRGPGSKLSPMNGLWLRQQRGQFKLSPQAVGAKLGVSALDIRLIEARQWSLPSEWFPALKSLFTAPASATSKKVASKPSGSAAIAAVKKDSAAKAESKTKSTPAAVATGKTTKAAPAGTSAKKVEAKAATKTEASKSPAKAPAKTEKPSVSTATAKVAAPAAKPVPSGEPGLAETIVSYRLMLGQHAGLSAVDVLAQIAADLQLAKGKDALTFEKLRAAMKVLTSR